MYLSLLQNGTLSTTEKKIDKRVKLLYRFTGRFIGHYIRRSFKNGKFGDPNQFCETLTNQNTFETFKNEFNLVTREIKETVEF